MSDRPRAPSMRRGARPDATAWGARFGVLLACIALLALAGPRAADAADEYPSRPIRIVVPSAGGQGDFVPRMIGKRLGEVVGQPVTIENRPGASYNIASDVVAKAAPDGYTLLYTGSVVTLLPSVIGSVAVDPVTSFAPITKLVETPLIVVANASLGVSSFDELIALARRRPGAIAYASPGVGTLPHLVATMIQRQAGIELLHIPYPNARQLLTDLLKGEVPVYFTFLIAVEPHVRSGQIRVLAVASARRMPQFPDVPTIGEAGFPQAAVEPWLGLLAPAGTPREIVDRLNRAVVAILNEPDVREQLVRQGMTPIGSTPERFAADIRAGVARWPPIVEAAGIRPQ